MLRTVMRVELKSALRDRTLWAALAIFAAFIAFAAFTSDRIMDAETARREQAIAAEAARSAELTEQARSIEAGAKAPSNADPTDPFAVGRELYPRQASLPHAPLAPLSNGQRDLLPQTVVLTTEPRFLDSAEAESQSPARRATGPFDLAFVLVFLLPLVIIATAFDLVSGERERGTLALILSQPISLTSFVFGKGLLRGLLVVGAAIALAVGGALLAGADLGAAGGITSLALFLGLVIAYAAFWFAASIAIGAWGRSSAANALALVGAWLLFVVVVPGLASVAIDTAAPSPSRIELVNAKRQAARDASSRQMDIEGNHGVAQDTEASKLQALAVQRDVEAQIEPVVAGFAERKREQQGLVDAVRFASPALLVHEGLTDVAGSGLARHQHFSAQVDGYHEELKAFFHPRVEAGEALRANEYAAMPRFAYREVPRSQLVGRVATSIVVLIALTAALLLAATIGLRRNRGRGLR